ncbi:AraC-type DNA-binding protein [Paraburkholderia hospita]|uniref:AraC family transcriptional regulator n=1 Tax=Paraburkholderia hospita TaxID=169430 RepID=A0AAN1JJJ4_9BURK|nr:AraC family transcriptional regulator [Paraburkholderia hospita]SEH86389.1 AraC-type DNA-binding protein [Paraburkholderia hospita]
MSDIDAMIQARSRRSSLQSESPHPDSLTALKIEHPTDGPTRLPYVHDYFSTASESPQQQLLAWRNRIGHILDVPVAKSQRESGFRGTIDSYRSADLAFMDCRTDAILQTRTAARISTDSARQFVFHVLVDGQIETKTGMYPKRVSTQIKPGILALDMGQPMRMERTDCRLLAIFLPREWLAPVLPEPESIHGHVIEYDSPLARLIPGYLAALSQTGQSINPADFHDALKTCAMLIAAAFGKRTGRAGGARAVARAAVFGTLRRYIEANLHEPDLSPESVLLASQLSRPTLYRLFESEGGLATYIRNRRLSQAADELRRYPNKAVVEIAYGLGFNSASDFNRAFRRAFDMSPLDFRMFTL